MLRDSYPEATIDFLTKPAFKGIVEAFGCVDEIYSWEAKRAVLKSIRKQKYDLVVDLHAKLNTAIIKFLSGAKKIITVNKRHWYRWALTKKLIKKPNDKMSYVYLKTLKKLKIEIKDLVPILHPDPVLKKKTAELITAAGINKDRRLIGIFPGALHYNKRYPVTNLAQFINLVPEEMNCQFLILGSQDDKHFADILIEKTETELIDLCGRVSLAELIALIDNLDAVISNDSGPMHITAALQKPQIAIFGSTHSILGFSPLNFNALVLQANLPCQPCSTYGLAKCPLGTLDCLKKITPAHLLDAFQELEKSFL
jgi:heptosyltransferase-2